MQDDIVAANLGSRQRARSDLDWVLILMAIDYRHSRLRAENPQLLHRGGASHVGRDQQRMTLAGVLEP